MSAAVCFGVVALAMLPPSLLRYRPTRSACRLL